MAKQEHGTLQTSTAILLYSSLLKWYKFGMSRAFDNLSIQIRYGMTSREEAISQITKLGPQVPISDIRAFCSFLDVDESWFWKICENYRNKEVWKRVDGTWQMKVSLQQTFAGKIFIV